MYRSAFGSLSTRDKRDLPTLTGLFQPVLRSIADLSVETNGLDSEHQGDPADIVVADVLRSMSKRAASWPSPIPDADLTALVSAEFTKAVRSIHINITKEIAAAKASADLKPEDLWTEEK
jgi:hypothetical protein